MLFFLSISNSKPRDPVTFEFFLSTVQLAWHFLGQICIWPRRSREEKVGAWAWLRIETHPVLLATALHMTRAPSSRPTSTRPHCEFSEISRKAVRCAVDAPLHCIALLWEGGWGCKDR